VAQGQRGIPAQLDPAQRVEYGGVRTHRHVELVEALPAVAARVAVDAEVPLPRPDERLGARGHVVFGGRVPLELHSFIERAMVKNTPPEFADRRDWEEISRWAAEIATQLEPTAELRPSPDLRRAFPARPAPPTGPMA
jgi:hypothetical protein